MMERAAAAIPPLAASPPTTQVAIVIRVALALGRAGDVMTPKPVHKIII